MSIEFDCNIKLYVKIDVKHNNILFIDLFKLNSRDIGT